MSAPVRHKVVLYNPKAVFWTMPLALMAVGSALDPTRYEVKIIDGRLEADPVQAVLKETRNALCLGISVLTGEPLRDALEVSRRVKREHPHVPIVWGGWHPSLFPAECLAEPSVDVAVAARVKRRSPIWLNASLREPH
ncbi:MAG: cobalamin B12-binding domain-containing protein [Chloroflexota bacterium]|nr:cobalamin B12-binding domain-containing protein [Chloroflexota bacterium]